jgi:acetyl-CoA carboxylase carboxyltransferase component
MAGGAMNETSALKGGRLHQIAIQNKLPTVTFVQSVNVISFFINSEMTTH